MFITYFEVCSLRKTASPAVLLTTVTYLYGEEVP